MNKDLKQLVNYQISKSLAHNSSRDILHSFQGIMISSFYDSTILNIKKTSLTNESDILKSINRNTGLQFKSISEIVQHVDTMALKKLLTD